MVLDIPKLNPNFLINDQKPYLPYISVFTKYKGDINDIEYNKLSLNAKILDSNPQSILKFNSGEIIVNNNKVNIKNLKGFIQNNKKLI